MTNPSPDTTDVSMPKKRFFLWLACIFIISCFIGAGFGFFPYWGKEPIAPVDVVQKVAEPDEDVSAAEAAAQNIPEPEDEPDLHQGVIGNGETAAVLLQEWLPPKEVHSFLEACKKVYPLGKIRAGQPYTVLKDAEGISRFEYEIDSDQKLVVCRNGDGYTASLEAIVYDVLLERITGSIEDNLFSSMAKLGETPVLAVRLADIFAWEINFIKDLQPGDTFSMLVEKRYRAGEHKGYGKMLFASFDNQGKRFEAYLFTDAFGSPAYFDGQGQSVKRAFLKAPLAFNRISSQFSMARLHPIHNVVRAHPAIDYAAPAGTPVKAIGGGVVTFAGFGRGAGNYIALKHHGGYESMYLHLSRFAKNVKQNNKVQQGEIIGFVGSTGDSTGPHLDFRMKKDGTWVDPAKVLGPRSEPIAAKDKAAFTAAMEKYKGYMEGKTSLSDYIFEKDMPKP